jgi:hypothetical protein
MRHMVQVQAKIQWEFYQDPASKRWIAVCEPLGLTIEADSHTELRENIEDSLRLFMRSIFADGQFERFMRERGWVAQNIPQNVAPQDIGFDVPIELIARKASNGAKRAVHQ